MAKRKNSKRRIQEKKVSFFKDQSFYLALSIVVLLLAFVFYTVKVMKERMMVNSYYAQQMNEMEQLSAEMDSIDIDDLEADINEFEQSL